MRKFLFFLTASPYGGQTAATALNLAKAVQDLGHEVTVFATGDGVHGFVKGQTPRGVFDVGGNAETLLVKGGAVEL